MKRILLIITKGDIGGAQMSVFSLAKEFQRQGHTVTVGCGEGDFLPLLLKEHHISHVRFSSLRRSYNPLHSLFFFSELLRYINTHQFDVVHFNSSNTLFGAIAATWSKYRPTTVFTFRGLSLLDPTYTSSRIRQVFYRLAFRFLLQWIDHPVFVSDDNKKTGAAQGIAPHGTVIYNGLDLPSLKPLSRSDAREWCEKRIGRPLDTNTVIGSIGRLAYQKNYEFLIQSMPDILAKHPQTICLIFGDGPERQHLEELIRARHLEQSVFLVGGIEHAYQYATAFDVFVLPSRYEGMSITLIEMLAIGVPIITTRVGGNEEQVGDGGLCYTLDNTKEFLEHLTRLVTSSDTRTALTERAKKRGQAFAIEKTATAYLTLYSRS